MATNLPTFLKDLIVPEVMGDMISGKIPSKIMVSPFAKIDTTLQGNPGDTKTVPSFQYIGDAVDMAEGETVDLSVLTASTTQFTIKKIMKSVGLTDEAVLSGLGNPVGQVNMQLAKAIASKMDNDCMDILTTVQVLDEDGLTVLTPGVQRIFDGSASQLKYAGIVDALDMFDEEVESEKVMFIHPKQRTTIRKDSDFLSADKYKGGVMLSGEIGTIAGVRLVISKKVKEIEGVYMNPIVKLGGDAEVENTDDELAAFTIFMKRDTMVETDRIPRSTTTEITANKFYGVALTDQSKVVLAKFKK